MARSLGNAVKFFDSVFFLVYFDPRSLFHVISPGSSHQCRMQSKQVDFAIPSCITAQATSYWVYNDHTCT